jgi:nanoRNase/pAp phosphatase (c-di-AMP/oligoRNAs hydrolase)
MARLLEIDVEQVKPRTLQDYDMRALVDAQPAFFEETLGDVDLVIDHHPEETPVRARLRDVRPSYGATSTILTEYLRAADVKIRERLATALLYGIKSDTLHLERGATRADMEAFAFLHPLANRNTLRRIERPDLPDAALDVLARGLASRRLADGVMFVHLGPVAYPELVAQFADFLLQVEGAEWSVVSGHLNGELHVSVRNVGWVRAAGEVVHVAFGDLGGAGGHRSMAKAVVRLRDWRAAGLPIGERDLGETIVTRFLAALRAARE